MKIFIILFLLFTIPAGSSVQAAPNLYQTLEDVDQLDILKVISIKGREALVQMPVDAPLDPMNQIFNVLDVKLSKSLGTVQIIKVINQKNRLYSGLWTAQKGLKLRVAAMKNLFAVVQKDAFLAKVAPFQANDRAAILSALNNRFNTVKIEASTAQDVPWLPGRTINPIADLRYIVSQHRFNTASLLIDSTRKFSPNASTLYFEGFIPHSKGYPWLNMLGVSLAYTQVDKYNVNYRAEPVAFTTRVGIDNDQSDFRFLIAPRFEFPVPYRLFLALSLYNQDHSAIDVARDGKPFVEYTVDREGMRYELGIDAILFKYARLGYSYTLPVEQSIKIKTIEDEIVSKDQGKSLISSHKLSLGAQFPWLPGHMYTPSFDLFFLLQEESYSFEKASSLADKSFRQRLFGGSLGISISLNI